MTKVKKVKSMGERIATIRKIKVDSIKIWGFVDDEGFIIPPDVCPFFTQRIDARIEKKKYSVYYSNTKIVPLEVVFALPKKSK